VNKLLFAQVSLAGLAIVVTAAFIARVTFLNGSLFDPAVAPAFGPFAVGDLLCIVPFIVGYFWSRRKEK